jgi:hypothetical protein
MVTERTAPRQVDDCPIPGSELRSWRTADRFYDRDFNDPRTAVEHAKTLKWHGENLIDAAVYGLLAEGLDPAAVASITGLSATKIREMAKQDAWTRQRRDYSVAYYQRHPGRTTGEWYPVEDGDPALPKSPIGVSTREA